MVGIVSYGFYLPYYRISTEEIAKVWGKRPDEVKKSLGISEKAVACNDEDSLSMGFESAQMAIEDLKIDKKKINIIFFVL